jgi:serine/threonine-protein kinase OSR1/STK39
MHCSLSDSSIPHWRFPPDSSQYELLHLIGRGAHGHSEVYSARCIPTGQLLAVKLIDLEHYAHDLDELRTQITLWSTCHDPHVIAYYGSFVADAVLWSLMEYVDGGSVADALHFAHREGFRDEAAIATILRHVLLFLCCFHAEHQVHRAICTHNILLSTQGDVKLGDFGAAAHTARRRASLPALDADCAAPEKCDIWSVGVTAIALATGHGPLEKGSACPSAARLGHHLADFVHQCMNRDPGKRPSAAALLKHPFMKHAKDKAYLAETVMAELPPLSQRLGHGKREKKSGEGTRRETPPVVFEFEGDGKREPDESESPEKVKE